MTRGAARGAVHATAWTGLLDATPQVAERGAVVAVPRAATSAGDLTRVERQGSLPAAHGRSASTTSWARATGSSRDTQIGSIGGGNHFVEIQRVEKILDGPTAHAWGLKPGMVTVMVHTGSVSIGHLCGGHYRDVVRASIRRRCKHPDNGIFVLPEGDRHRRGLGLAAQRRELRVRQPAVPGLMAWRTARVSAMPISPCSTMLPHNLLWRETQDGRGDCAASQGRLPGPRLRGDGRHAVRLLRRAGAGARLDGREQLHPGRAGKREALFSASHGAGRALSRGEAVKGHDEEFEEFLARFRVVTPVDLPPPGRAIRRDIVEKKLADIKQEAPFAYKGIGPIVDTLTAAGIARPVAELTPLMTMKG